MKNFQSGDYVQQGHYKSFQPRLIDRVWLLDNMELIQLPGRAAEGVTSTPETSSPTGLAAAE